MTFDLEFDHQGQIQGTGYRPEITSARVAKWSQTVASLPEQLAQPCPWTCHLTFQVKLNVKRQGTRYLTEATSVTSARLTKWSQLIASLTEQLTRP